MLKLFYLFVATSVLCSCGGPRDVVSEYKDTARSIGVTPVYPPEETLQVGDVFIQSVAKTNGDELRDNTNDKVQVFFASSSEFLRRAQEHMNSRVVFRRTKSENRPGNLATQRDTLNGAFLTRGDRSIETLPIVAFPEVTADEGSNFGFSLVRVFHALGLGAGQRTQVKLNFNDVRKYGIPKITSYVDAGAEANKAYLKQRDAVIKSGKGDESVSREDLIGGYHRTLNKVLHRETQNEQLRLKKAKQSVRLSSDRCKRFLTITEVYLTRKITYTFANAEILALAARQLTEGFEAGASKANLAPTPPVTTININNGPLVDGAGNDISPITIADPATNRQNVLTSIAGANVGEGLVFDKFTARGAQFSKAFERPVVIGYSGVDTPFPTPYFFGGLPNPLVPEDPKKPNGRKKLKHPITERCIKEKL